MTRVPGRFHITGGVGDGVVLGVIHYLFSCCWQVDPAAVRPCAGALPVGQGECHQQHVQHIQQDRLQV